MNKEAKTRVSINSKTKSIEIQAAKKTPGGDKLKFMTVASSIGDEDAGIPNFMSSDSHINNGENK